MFWCSLATTQCATMDEAQQLYLGLGYAADAFGDDIPQNATKQFAHLFFLYVFPALSSTCRSVPFSRVSVSPAHT